MSAANTDVPVRRIRWQRTYRIISTRFPHVHVFDRVADPADFDALYQIEAMTNPRLRDELGEIEMVPRGDRVFGPGASYVMAPFTHVSPSGGRFSDPTFGAYYTARARRTAIRETVYHRERFLAATATPPTELEMSVLEAKLDARLHDIRLLRVQRPELYASDDYGAPQAFARELRRQDSNGVVYRSVRDEKGECAAVYRPRLIVGCRITEWLLYRWNGSRITDVLTKVEP